MSTKLSACAVEAVRVWQMQLGDKAAVQEGAIIAPGRTPFIYAEAVLYLVGPGLVTVERKNGGHGEGFYIDCRNVSEARFGQEKPVAKVYRVKGVTGLACMG